MTFQVKRLTSAANLDATRRNFSSPLLCHKQLCFLELASPHFGGLSLSHVARGRGRLQAADAPFQIVHELVQSCARFSVHTSCPEFAARRSLGMCPSLGMRPDRISIACTCDSDPCGALSTSLLGAVSGSTPSLLPSMVDASGSDASTACEAVIYG